MGKQKPPVPRNTLHKHQQSPTILASAHQWSGPLPPPAALEHFNQIIPNGAERIMTMVEQEQAHRIKYESSGLEATIADTRRGHWLGSIISLAAVAGSIFTAYIGAPAAVSVALVSVPIFSIVNAILKNKSK